MPTFEPEPSFLNDFKALTPEQKRLFRVARRKFVADLRVGRFRSGLRVKGYQGIPGALEMTWAPDGRALFQFGAPVRGDEPHIIWLRVGTHDIFE